MKKMSTTAKVLSVFAKIAMILAIACGTLLAIVTVVVAFAEEKAFTEASTNLIIGNVSFTLAPDMNLDAAAIKWHSIAILGIAAAVMFAGAYMTKIVRKALKPVAEQNPFDEAVYRNIRKLGILTIVFGVIMQIINFAVEIAMVYCYDFEKIFINNNITALEFDFEFDGSFVFVAIVLFMLSGVFKYGAELQQQSDETL